MQFQDAPNLYHEHLGTVSQHSITLKTWPSPDSAAKHILVWLVLGWETTGEVTTISTLGKDVL